MQDLINFLPIEWIFILSMLFYLLLGFLTVFVNVNFISKPCVGDKEHRKMENILIGILSGGFSILLAFIIINTWNYQLQARVTVAKEADYISIIMHNIFSFPAAEKEKMTEVIRNYTVAVRVNEWKKMQKGSESKKAWHAINDLYKTIQAYQPETSLQSLYYSRVVAAVNELLKARRERLNFINSVIPDPLRTSLFIGSILLVLILGGVRSETNFFRMMPYLVFTMVLGFNIALAISFDYPYSGSIAVSNKPFYSGALSRLSDHEPGGGFE